MSRIWVARAMCVFAFLWMPALNAGILTGSFTGTAYDSRMYFGPQGPYYPEGISVDGQTVTGTFSLHTGNFVRMWHTDTYAIFRLPPWELDFHLAGHHIEYERGPGSTSPYGPTLVLRRAEDYQSLVVYLPQHRGSVDFELRAAPGALFTDLDPSTLHGGIVDLANSVIAFNEVSPIGTILRTRIALTNVSFGPPSPVPAAGSLWLAGIGLCLCGMVTRRLNAARPGVTA